MSKKIMLNGVDYTGVYSIKGNAESAYRTGDVNITPANIGLGNVNNTADSEKSVKYATSAGSASSVSWANVSGKPSTFTPSSHTHDDRYYTESEINTKLNNKANVFKYEFSNHDVYRCLGTATLKQEGDYLILHIYCGDGYNADINQDRTIDVHIRASNGSAVNGKYYIGYIESHLNGATNCNVYVVQNSSTSFTIWIGKLNYSGRSFYEVQFPSGDSWVPAANTSTTIPTNGVALIEKKIAYTDVATTSTNGLMSKDMVSKLNGIAEGANKTIVDANLSSTSTNPVQNKVVNAALVKKADTISYDKSSSTLYLKSGSTVLSSTEIKSGGGTTITPKPTVNPQIKNDDKKVVITWEDPTDTVIEGSTFSKWAGTKLVMKESGYPTSPDDGTVLVDNTTRDKYKTTGFTKDGLTNDKQYYFALFPYSTDGVYNYDSGNRLLGEPTELKIVTFAGGTDAEIAKMIQAHYNDKINIADYWAVGDTRTVSLSAMSATGVGESHRAQTVQLVILDFEHDDLATAINGHSKAAVSIGLKDCLMDASNASNPVNGGGNTENGYMNSSATNAGGWKNCARRAWCNNVFFAALPSTWQSMVKIVNKKSGTGGGSSSGTEITADKIFLAAEIEIFGSRTYSVDGEGTQYQYYKNATTNRYKMPKWSSGYVSNVYWERSPFSEGASAFCDVDDDGDANSSFATNAYGFAPCLCI